MYVISESQMCTNTVNFMKRRRPRKDGSSLGRWPGKYKVHVKCSIGTQARRRKKKEGMTGGRRLRRKNGVEKMHKPKTKRKE